MFPYEKTQIRIHQFLKEACTASQLSCYVGLPTASGLELPYRMGLPHGLGFKALALLNPKP